MSKSPLIKREVPQTSQRIAIQGVRGAFHEIAAKQFFGNEIEIVPALSFAELVQEVSNCQNADAGLMAIENSIAGSILGNYMLLNNSDLCIIGEVSLRIQQNLLAMPGIKIEDLNEVHSHPMALAQCANFFKKHRHIRLVESEDTAKSAAEIAHKKLKHRAAIGSVLASTLYGLNILSAAIEDNPQNFTRFLVVQSSAQAALPENANKVSICFSTPHVQGSLNRVLTMLAKNKANLTKIQSVPLLGRPYEYLFFADFVIENPENIARILEQLKDLVIAFKVLGIYKSAEIK